MTIETAYGVGSSAILVKAWAAIRRRYVLVLDGFPVLECLGVRSHGSGTRGEVWYLFVIISG